MDWKKLRDETPIALKSGNWDGLKSDTLLLISQEGRVHVGEMYEGCIDGNHFRNFYDPISEYEIENVVMWSYVKPL